MNSDFSSTTSSTPRMTDGGSVTSRQSDTRTTETRELISSDKVEGTSVKRPNGDSVGQIERLMIDKRSGKVAYVVMSFGGFLGIGADYYPIPWGKLKYNEQLDAYELDVSEDMMRAAPHYADENAFDWGNRQRGQEIYDYYGVTPYWGL